MLFSLYQQAAGAFLQKCGHFRRQAAGDGPGNTQVEGSYCREAARPPAARHAHPAAAADGEKALVEFFFIGKDRIPAKVLETVLHLFGCEPAQPVRPGQVLGRRAYPAIDRKQHRLPGPQADFLHIGRTAYGQGGQLGRVGLGQTLCQAIILVHFPLHLTLPLYVRRGGYRTHRQKISQLLDKTPFRCYG